MENHTTGTIYTDGSYFAKTGGTWHLEDSPFKARQVFKMLERHPEINPATVCEIGCGAGGILAALQTLLPTHVCFTGYEISPQASVLSARFANRQCRYLLSDAFEDPAVYDLVMVMDVVEHVEDCFSFLRRAKKKGRMKIYHIPLDTHVSALVRGLNAWESVGHIHLFTIETALKSVEYSGHRVVDWFLTDGALAKPNKTFSTNIANVIRRALGCVSVNFAARLVGGYSIMILAE
jgi:cyclopropane fatty-acyl-phospholipid synthase-like methyltransferase